MEGTGLQALEVIQDHPASKDAALIMISSEQQSKVAVSAFRSGFHDFIQKEELSPIVLQDAVRGAMRSCRSHVLDQNVVFNDLDSRIRKALRASLENGELLLALTDGVRMAAQTVGLENHADDTKNLEDFYSSFGCSDDEFIFED